MMTFPSYGGFSGGKLFESNDKQFICCYSTEFFRLESFWYFRQQKHIYILMKLGKILPKAVL